MTFEVRRVVTGHDADGKAVVTYDGISTNVRSGRPGQAGCVMWTSDSFPADNSAGDDEALRPVGTGLEGGAVFRLVQYGPGVAPRNHRTSTIDYAVVVSGEIDMELDEAVVHLVAGDVLVQRGTIHNWVNRGTEPCVIAFTLIDAKPVEVGGKGLPDFG